MKEMTVISWGHSEGTNNITPFINKRVAYFINPEAYKKLSKLGHETTHTISKNIGRGFGLDEELSFMGRSYDSIVNYARNNEQSKHMQLFLGRVKLTEFKSVRLKTYVII